MINWIIREWYKCEECKTTLQIPHPNTLSESFNPNGLSCSVCAGDMIHQQLDLTDNWQAGIDIEDIKLTVEGLSLLQSIVSENEEL